MRTPQAPAMGSREGRCRTPMAEPWPPSPVTDRGAHPALAAASPSTPTSQAWRAASAIGDARESAGSRSSALATTPLTFLPAAATDGPNGHHGQGRFFQRGARSGPWQHRSDGPSRSMWLPWSCLHRVRVAPTAPCGRRKHRRGRGRRWCRRQPPDPTLRPWPPRPTPCPGCRPGRAGGLCWQPPRTSVQPASRSGSLAAFLTFRRNSCDRLPRGRAAKQALATISASHSWASSTATGPARTSTRAPQAAPLCIYAGGPLGRDSVSPVRRRGHQAFTLPLQVARLALLRTHRSEPAVLDRRRVSTSGGEMRRSSEMETTVSTEMGSGWLGVGSRVVGLRRPACSFTVALSSCRHEVNSREPALGHESSAQRGFACARTT